MRVMCSVLMSFLALGLFAWGSPAYGEPIEQPGISFSLPYTCGADGNGRHTHTAKLCLADAFKAGLSVVLASQPGNCSAKTAGTFMDEAGGGEFKATHLTDPAKCFALDDKMGFEIAVIGIDSSEVRVVKPKYEKSPLSKEIELKARKIAGSAYKKIHPSQPVADVAASPPDVFSVGNAAFLLFRSTFEFLNQDGLPVFVLKNNAFLLEGACAFVPPFFFSVREKLYLAYWATVSCCGCGDMNFFVYDISGELPKLVYQNYDFSN